MDISGVDIDFLNSEEILDLCSNIVDYSEDEISIVDDNVNNLSDDKVQEIYDNVIFSNNDTVLPNKINLTNEQILDNNYNTVDMDFNEIALLNGYNINLDNIPDDEVLALYDETLSTDNILIAAKAYCVGGSGTKYMGNTSCYGYSAGYYSYGTIYPFYFRCYISGAGYYPNSSQYNTCRWTYYGYTYVYGLWSYNESAAYEVAQGFSCDVSAVYSYSAYINCAVGTYKNKYNYSTYGVVYKDWVVQFTVYK